MDEQAAGAAALGLVVLIMVAFLGAVLLNRSGVAPIWLGVGMAFVATVTVVVTFEARRR
jgi:predicted signal transduction protein with EAL and GGDEF domain